MNSTSWWEELQSHIVNTGRTVTMPVFAIYHGSVQSFPGGSDDKESARNVGKPGSFNPWGKKIPWWREGQPTPVFSPGKFHGQRSLAGYSPRGCKESDTTERLTFTFTFIVLYKDLWGKKKLVHIHAKAFLGIVLAEVVNQGQSSARKGHGTAFT